MYDPPRIAIELADGTTVKRFDSAASWRAARKGPFDLGRRNAAPVTADDLVEEKHHHYYGKPWVAGRYFFEHLLTRGVAPTDHVLDIGCGVGRVGVWLIPYLDRCHYFGVDSHLGSLVAFGHYEALLHNLAPRRPRLMLNRKFEFAAFGTSFQVILQFGVTTDKANLATIQRAFDLTRAVLAPNGRLIFAQPPKLGVDGMADLGFELVHREVVHYPIFAWTTKGQDSSEWFEFRATEG